MNDYISPWCSVRWKSRPMLNSKQIESVVNSINVPMLMPKYYDRYIRDFIMSEVMIPEKNNSRNLLLLLC